MQPGLVSIMMPAYNAERYIGQAMESILAQSYTNWELILVNDGSTDTTVSVATRYTDPRIKLIHQVNGGESAARNTALEKMTGEFVAFLDADDVYLPNHLEAAVGCLANFPSCDGVYTDGYYCNQSGTPIKTLSSRRRGPFEGRVFEEVVRASDVFGPPLCVVLRYNVIAPYNLRFDTNIVIGPDWDFFVQFADVAQFRYVDQYTCMYRVHQSNITFRTNLKERALNTAKCRTKAIKMQNFAACSPETRLVVFYDLLVNQLGGFPERQAAITQWSEFMDLSTVHQAKLLRLMASKAIMNGGDRNYIDEWLCRSRKLNPSDHRGALLYTAYKTNPFFCKLLLRVKTIHQTDPLNTPPFQDLQEVSSGRANRAFS